jgi:CopG family nickel-responsive transcriptional regulator
MSDLVRMSFTIERPLCERLETMMKSSRSTNRSEFLRNLMRERLVERRWERDRTALCTLTIVYNHHKRRLGEKLTDIQHEHYKNILGTMHIHLSHDLCAEVVLMKGRASELISMCDEMRRQKSVLHATISRSTTGEQLE